MKRILAIGVLLLPALAFTPQEALGYRSPESAPAQERVNAAQAQLDAVRLGLSGSASVSRGLYDEGRWGYGIGVGFQLAGTNLLEAERNLETARRELQKSQRDATRRALLAHARLWEAETAQRAAERRGEAAQQRLAEIERRAGLGAVTATEREEAQLTATEVALSSRQAQAGLGAARAEATALGFSGSASPAVLGLALPEAQVQNLPAYREAFWALRLAQAQRSDAGLALWPRVTLDGSFIGNDASLALSLQSRGAQDVRPAANFSISGPASDTGLPTQPSQVPPGQPGTGQNEWRFSLRAEIAVSPQIFAQLRQLDAEQSAASIRLATLQNDLTRQLEQTRQNATLAQESLGLAQQRLELATRRRELAEARAQNGAASPLDVLEARAQEADAEGRVAAAWRVYIEAVGAYLDLTGGNWEVAR